MLTGFYRTLKTTCSRTSSWKIWLGFTASGSIFRRLMINVFIPPRPLPNQVRNQSGN